MLHKRHKKISLKKKIVSGLKQINKKTPPRKKLINKSLKQKIRLRIWLKELKKMAK